MKKTMMKKAFASVTALLAVSAMMIPAAVGAVNTPTINESPANVIATPANTADVTVKKDIVLFNTDGSPILSPNITYNYDITPAAVTTAKITTYAPDDFENGELKGDATPITVTVKPGIIGAVTTGNDDDATTNKVEGKIAFGAADDTKGNDNATKHNANREDATEVTLSNKVTNSMTITVDASKIYDTNGDGKQDNGPGVYRYKIEDVTTDAALKAAGIERNYETEDGNTDKYIYLDVYTKYNADKNGLVVYGYVLLKDTTGKDNVDITYKKDTTAETLKITGFDTESENDDTFGEETVARTDMTSDAYHTYNVEVQKVTAGDLADTQNNFPFTINLTNSEVVTSLDDFYYQINKDGTALDEVITNLAADGKWALDGNTASTNLQLQNGDKILITGLPVGTQIAVKEKNNTADTYSVSATVNGAATALKSGTASGNTLSVAAEADAELNAAANVEKANGKDVIVFTNTLKDISVTGLLFSIAPFAFITIAGIALLGLFMRNKKDEASESRI